MFQAVNLRTRSRDFLNIKQQQREIPAKRSLVFLFLGLGEESV
jgi:hypothetical protein